MESFSRLAATLSVVARGRTSFDVELLVPV
jgi:hypothetical protein